MSIKAHQDLRNLFHTFWNERKHSLVVPVSLVPKEDSTTLFTSSGMQPLIRYLSGTPHPQGRRLYNIQPCFRAVDIDEVGDNRHTTFFEMMGNWSLGDYFKKDQLAWVWEFFTEKLKLSKEKLYVTVFEGNKNVPKDEESYSLWKKLGVSDDHIQWYGVEKNWWSRAGTPDKMPEGEIGGPDSEVFYDFGTLHDKRFGTECHPNCDCGRFLEIGNSVFIQYRKKKEGTLNELPQKNVDFGGGLERILAALNNDPDVFKTDVFDKIIAEIVEKTDKSYEDKRNTAHMRVIADHLKASVFLIKEGVVPSNKEQGYVLRRLLRRSAVKMYQLGGGLTPNFDTICDRGVLATYDGTFGIERDTQNQTFLFSVINDEMKRFASSLDMGLKLFQKAKSIDGKVAFDLYQSYGFPFEIISELASQRGERVSREEFDAELNKHKELSRTSSAGMFTGGLADHSEQVVKYHTATHLLHQALRDVLGDKVRQKGSNITGERLRFDFYSDDKPTDEDMQKVEEIINKKIKEALSVICKIMPKKEAEALGASAFFKEKYGNEVMVYLIGEYSKEFCGGPHVRNTSEIGSLKIFKLKKIGSQLFRVYAK